MSFNDSAPLGLPDDRSLHHPPGDRTHHQNGNSNGNRLNHISIPSKQLRGGESRALIPKKSITLALGGGGARGLAHLGVVEVLLQHGYHIERIVGISIGSLVGAMLAFEQSIAKIETTAVAYLLSPEFQQHQKTLFGCGTTSPEDQTFGLFSWYAHIQAYLRANSIFHRIISQPGMLPGVILQDVVDHFLPDEQIENASIPLTIVATDLKSGRLVRLDKGSIRAAVKGSSSLPGIFPPVIFDDMQLCDCGNFYTLPTTIARCYTNKFVLGVEVSYDIKPLKQCRTAIEALVRVDEIGENFWRQQIRSAANFTLRPDVSHLQWFDFSAADKMIEVGRQAATLAMPEIDRAYDQMQEFEFDATTLNPCPA